MLRRLKICPFFEELIATRKYLCTPNFNINKKTEFSSPTGSQKKRKKTPEALQSYLKTLNVLETLDQVNV